LKGKTKRDLNGCHYFLTIQRITQETAVIAKAEISDTRYERKLLQGLKPFTATPLGGILCFDRSKLNVLGLFASKGLNAGRQNKLPYDSLGCLGRPVRARLWGTGQHGDQTRGGADLPAEILSFRRR
jgi:hypothetical protein